MPHALVTPAMDFETTCRMPRSELLGLLNTMTPIEQQRITAEIPAQAPPAELSIRFKTPRAVIMRRMIVIGASFVIAFAVGLFAAL